MRWFTLLIPLAWPVVAQEAAAPADADSENLARGLEAFAIVHEVASHPRCANCHVSDGVPRWSGPSYGAPRAHGMNVRTDPEEGTGPAFLPCETCHGPANAPVPHGPPGSPDWHLAPPEMVWWDRSAAEVCSQIKDPARNGGLTLEEVAEHIEHDELVLWGWAPGPGREPAPHSAEAAAAAVRIWAGAGAPCP